MDWDKDARELVRLYNSIEIDEYIKEENIDIFHYTSPSALDGILSTSKLWLTDRQFLNDTKEGVYILDECIKLIEEKNFKDEFYKCLKKECENRKKKIFQEQGFYVYQISFSYADDDFSLWSYYSRGNGGIDGYNLKFNSIELLRKMDIKLKLESGKIPKLYGGKVIYDEDKQDEIIYDIISKFKVHHDLYGNTDNLLFKWLVDKLVMIGSFFKSKDFAAEKEYRIIINLYLNDKREYDTVSNQKGEFKRNIYSIPYIEVEFNKSCLQGITISPTKDYEKICSNILNVTTGKFNKINQDTIRKSKISLRY